ncbi:dienelactone hydrolase family protein [Dokdonella sp.]|uniref:dienelactone hydrolase family protein n=1 Tax=Dokdonella sp. TaxID=2291710 RepID=UPI0025C3B2E7|nr:dienelactone hydrolase family protein [Dokdonella sp.]MBX3692613.1 dienelactone hydrolase family protein [Dokdonella sp.]
MGERLQIATAGMHCISAWIARPKGMPKGGVVVAQEIFGVNAHVRNLVERLAEAGHVAIAPAFFDHLEQGVELDYDEAGIARGRALAGELGLERAVADVMAAAEAIASAGRIGVVGFCWGGTVALLAALRHGLPAVSFYGARNVAWLGEATDVPLQFHFGERDASIPPEAVQRHREALPHAEVHTYPAGHGFNCDQRADHDPVSATLAWQRTLEFLNRHLAGKV